ncbi:MAG: ORF2 [Yushu Rhabd tick virus 2]|uniref:ORF2 n=1 Tax=Yushu Rhabd tick virus 2 TaxID=2972332 RepID=A0A9E7V2C0_9RHAB|nr:MAG: ORF2 [Yushu Rhabd tick virus 2]
MSDRRQELPLFNSDLLPDGEALNQACVLQGAADDTRDILGLGSGAEDAAQSTNPMDAIYRLPFTDNPLPAPITVAEAKAAFDKLTAEKGLTDFQLPGPSTSSQPAGASELSTQRPLTPTASDESDDNMPDPGPDPTDHTIADDDKGNESDTGTQFEDRPYAAVTLEERHLNNEDIQQIAEYLLQITNQLKEQKVFSSADVDFINGSLVLRYRLIPAITIAGEKPPAPLPSKPLSVSLPPVVTAPSVVKSPEPLPSTSKATTVPDTVPKKTETKSDPTPKLPKESSDPPPKISKLSREAPLATRPAPTHAITADQTSALNSLLRTPYTFSRKGGGLTTISIDQHGVTKERLLDALRSKNVDLESFLRRPRHIQIWTALNVTESGKRFKLSSFAPKGP